MFTDEKIYTVATPKNPQNDWQYTPAATKKKDVATKRLHKDGWQHISSILVDHWVKINEACVCYTWLIDWAGFNVPLNTLQVISGTGFTGQMTQPTVSKH